MLGFCDRFVSVIEKVKKKNVSHCRWQFKKEKLISPLGVVVYTNLVTKKKLHHISNYLYKLHYACKKIDVSISIMRLDFQVSYMFFKFLHSYFILKNPSIITSFTDNIKVITPRNELKLITIIIRLWSFSTTRILTCHILL